MSSSGDFRVAKVVAGNYFPESLKPPLDMTSINVMWDLDMVGEGVMGDGTHNDHANLGGSYIFDQ